MDLESWYSVTPECMATQIAEQIQACHVSTIIDGFCGAGGNAIAFAQVVDKVIAWDTDLVKIKCAMHNAEIYGVREKIEFRHGDFFELIEDESYMESIKAECIFISPPWGGPDYNAQEVFDIDQMKPYSARALVKAASRVTNEVVLYLPRQSNQKQLAALRQAPGSVELQYLMCSGKLKALCVYLGDLASPVNEWNTDVTDLPERIDMPNEVDEFEEEDEFDD